MKIELSITAGNAKQFPRDNKMQIALSGRSNVGKSSLLNVLAGRKNLARVSSEPGKTITINFYNFNDDFYLVDMPGYGYAKRSFEQKKEWSALTNSYFTEDGSNGMLVTVIQLIDLKTGPSKDDLTMIEWLKSSPYDWFIVATKSDKPNKTDREKNLQALIDLVGGIDVIPFSSLKGEGKDAVLKRIYSKIK